MAQRALNGTHWRIQTLQQDDVWFSPHSFLYTATAVLSNVLTCAPSHQSPAIHAGREHDQCSDSRAGWCTCGHDALCGVGPSRAHSHDANKQQHWAGLMHDHTSAGTIAVASGVHAVVLSLDWPIYDCAAGLAVGR